MSLMFNCWANQFDVTYCRNPDFLKEIILSRVFFTFFSYLGIQGFPLGRGRGGNNQKNPSVPTIVLYTNETMPWHFMHSILQ